MNHNLSSFLCKVLGHDIPVHTMELVQDGNTYKVLNGKTYLNDKEVFIRCWHGKSQFTCQRCKKVIPSMDYSGICVCKNQKQKEMTLWLKS